MDNQAPILYTAKESQEKDGLFTPKESLEATWEKITQWNTRNGFHHLNTLEALMILVPEKADALATSMGKLAHVEISHAHINDFLRAYKAARDVIVGWHHQIRSSDKRARNIGKLHTSYPKPLTIKKEFKQCGLLPEIKKDDVLRKPRIQQGGRRASEAASRSKQGTLPSGWSTSGES